MFGTANIEIISLFCHSLHDGTYSSFMIDYNKIKECLYVHTNGIHTLRSELSKTSKRGQQPTKQNVPGQL